LASIYQYQSSALQNTTSIYVQLNNTQQNDVIAVIVAVKGNSVFPSSITDSIGNSYLPTVTQAQYNNISIFYAINKGSGANTITVNFPSAVDAMLIALELSGINLSNPVSGQIAQSGDTINPSISISPASTGQFVLGALLYEYVTPGTTPSSEAGVLSPASPALQFTSIGIPSDYLETSVEYVPDSNNLSAISWISQQTNLPYWDAIVVLFNLPPTQTTTSPCSGLPFPLNDICYSVTSLSQQITSTGQGIFNGLSYVAQAFYNAFSTLAEDFMSAWQYLSSNIYNAFNTFGQWIQTGFNNLATQFYNAWLYLSQHVFNAFNTFGQWIDTAFKDIGTWLYNAFNYIYTGLTYFGNWIWSGITSFATMVVNFANWAWQGIVGTFNAIYNAFTTGTEQLISSFESGIVGIQNALVNKLHDMIVVSLTMPAEFSLFNAFKNNLATGNMKGTLGSLGGVLATPILADIIATFLSNYIKPQQISKVLPRPTLPSITMPTPTLQYSPTPIQTSAPPTVTPPTSIPPSTTPTAQATSLVSYQVGGAVPPQSLSASPTATLSINGASQPASPQSLTASPTTTLSINGASQPPPQQSLTATASTSVSASVSSSSS